GLAAGLVMLRPDRRESPVYSRCLTGAVVGCVVYYALYFSKSLFYDNMLVGGLTMGAAAALCVGLLEARLRPMAVTIAQAQLQNDAARLVERCVTEDLAERGLTYAELVSIQRDTSGAIVSLTTDMAAMNLLRAELVERVLDALEGVGVLQLRIPLGSLLDLDVLWGLGPSLKVHAMAVGTADARFSSSFSEAGVNQTLHRIELELTVPMTLLLPGGPVETESVTRLCVAETVIVGRVPDAYLQMERPGGG
ncbi:MAG: sporulation protein YunB, partial [Clostridiales bacterium]|nr:sporulation protein YunB [Clostridiales bacterium]